MTPNLSDPPGPKDGLSRQGWTPLLDALPQGVMLVDAQGRYLEVNRAAERILARDRETLLSCVLPEPWSNAAAGAGAEHAVEAFPGLVALRTGTPAGPSTLGWSREDGSTAWLQVSAQALPGGGVLLSFEDISALTEAHQDLQASEEQHRFLAENAVDVIWTMDLHGRVTYMSPSVERLRGYTPAEVMGKSLFETLPPAYAAAAREAFRTRLGCVTSGQPVPEFRGEFELQRKDGTLVWTEVTVTSMVNQVGRFIGFLGVTRDIDDRKKMELMLQDKEERYRAQFSLAGEGIVTQTLEGDLIEVNDAYARMHGYRPDEMAHMRLRDLDHPESFKVSKDRLARLLAGEVLSFEVKHFHRDGHVFPLEVSAGVITSGGKSRILAFHRDITERKKAEELLREEHQFSTQIIQSAQEGIIVYGLDLKYLVWNPFMEKLTGIPASEVLGKHPLEVFPMLQELGVLERLEKALAGQPAGSLDYQYLAKGAAEHRCNSNTSSALRNSKGEIIGVLGIVHDVTARKQMEEAIIIQNEMFQNVLDTIPQYICWKDKTSKFLGCNKNFAKMVNLPDTKSIIGKRDCDLSWNKEQTEHFLRHDRNIMEANAAKYHIIEYALDASGNTRCLDTNKMPLHDAEGKVNGVLVAFEDITERRRDEQSLRSQTALLEAQLNATVDGILVVTEQGRRKLINARLVELFEVPGDILADEDDGPLLDHVVKRTKNPEEFLEKVKYLYDHQAETSRDEIEFTNGMILDRYSSPVLGNDGTYHGRIWTFRDISERKRAEEALRESEQRYRNQFDLAGEGIFSLSPEGVLVDVNAAFAQMHGYSVQEMLGMHIKDVVTPELLAGVGFERIQKLLQGGSLLFETEHIHKDGHVFPVEVSACLVSTGGKKAILGFHRDITERKSLESALERRIIALTQPMGDLGRLLFEELFNLADIQKIQDAFAQATGVASIITRPDGTPITRPSNFTYLCSELIRTTEQGRLKCFESDAAVGGYHPAGPMVQPCFSCGLWDAGTSISVGGYHVANWMIGQVRDESQSQEKMAAYAREIGVDEGRFLKAFYEVPSMSRERFNQIAESLFILGGRLSDSAYQNIQQARLIAEKDSAEAEVRRLNENLEKRVQERTLQLEIANKEMEAFSYSVSHDLRAPLRSIDGFARILVEDYQDELDAAGRQHLSRINLATRRMGNLIDDLLKLSKTSRSELAVSDCDLSRLGSRVTGNLADLNPERRVEVFIHSGMRVQADPNLLQVVLENLLGNAWKFTARCQDPRIELGESAAPDGERVFFIRDNGAGFDLAQAGQLFAPFQRFHAASEFEGTGIGLALVQRIIHRHGGRIWAEAEPGKGATFHFTLPAAGI